MDDSLVVTGVELLGPDSVLETGDSIEFTVWGPVSGIGTSENDYLQACDDLYAYILNNTYESSNPVFQKVRFESFEPQSVIKANGVPQNLSIRIRGTVVDNPIPVIIWVIAVSAAAIGFVFWTGKPFVESVTRLVWGPSKTVTTKYPDGTEVTTTGPQEGGGLFGGLSTLAMIGAGIFIFTKIHK